MVTRGEDCGVGKRAGTLGYFASTLTEAHATKQCQLARERSSRFVPFLAGVRHGNNEPQPSIDVCAAGEYRIRCAAEEVADLVGHVELCLSADGRLVDGREEADAEDEVENQTKTFKVFGPGPEPANEDERRRDPAGETQILVVKVGSVLPAVNHSLHDYTDNGEDAWNDHQGGEHLQHDLPFARQRAARQTRRLSVGRQR